MDGSFTFLGLSERVVGSFLATALGKRVSLFWRRYPGTARVSIALLVVGAIALAVTYFNGSLFDVWPARSRPRVRISTVEENRYSSYLFRGAPADPKNFPEPMDVYFESTDRSPESVRLSDTTDIEPPEIYSRIYRSDERREAELQVLQGLYVAWRLKVLDVNLVGERFEGILAWVPRYARESDRLVIAKFDSADEWEMKWIVAENPGLWIEVICRFAGVSHGILRLDDCKLVRIDHEPYEGAELDSRFD